MLNLWWRGQKCPAVEGVDRQELPEPRLVEVSPGKSKQPWQREAQELLPMETRCSHGYLRAQPGPQVEQQLDDTAERKAADSRAF